MRTLWICSRQLAKLSVPRSNMNQMVGLVGPVWFSLTVRIQPRPLSVCSMTLVAISTFANDNQPNSPVISTVAVPSALPSSNTCTPDPRAMPWTAPIQQAPSRRTRSCNATGFFSAGKIGDVLLYNLKNALRGGSFIILLFSSLPPFTMA